MMRPMKLGGEQLMFGQGVLEHLKTIVGKKGCYCNKWRSSVCQWAYV